MQTFTFLTKLGSRMWDICETQTNIFRGYFGHFKGFRAFLEACTGNSLISVLIVREHITLCVFGFKIMHMTVKLTANYTLGCKVVNFVHWC